MSKRKLNVKIGDYIPRGKEISSDFMKDMESYHLLMEYTKDESNGLDVQLRGKYMNIYYLGGSLVRLTGRSICDIDKNYFYVTGKDNLCMSDIERLCHQDYVEKSKLSKALKGRGSQLPELRKEAISIMKHYSDYCATVGDENKWQSFVNDIEILLDAKKRTEIIDKDVTIKRSRPKFAFILKQENESDKEEFEKALEKDNLSDIPTLYLPIESDWDNPKAESNKLAKMFMR